MAGALGTRAAARTLPGVIAESSSTGPSKCCRCQRAGGVARALARRLGREAGLAPPRRSALHIAQRLGRAGAPKQRPCDLLASTKNHQYTNAAAFSLMTRGGQHACVSR